ncbi:hypothetical protein EYC80_006891 [Monilinia laxa]|uniref:Uncharacterized protein n=1 Tax=Monilinia laxa TaxID=61186 RepID=A0A5N6JZG7_MONLA|nr:hypothetical protein EYC80_006891 [Monilinia laxa]
MVWMDGCMEIIDDASIYLFVYLSGWMDGWMDGWMGGWIYDGYVLYVCITLPADDQPALNWKKRVPCLC